MSMIVYEASSTWSIVLTYLTESLANSFSEMSLQPAPKRLRKTPPPRTKINYASFRPVGCGLGVLQSPSQVIDPTNDDESLPDNEIFPIEQFPPLPQIETSQQASQLSTLTSAYLMPPTTEKQPLFHNLQFPATPFGQTEVSIALGKAVKVHLFRYWKFAKEGYDWHFDFDTTSICGFLLDILNVSQSHEKWWDVNRKTIKTMLTNQRNNAIKNIQITFKGKY